MAYSGPTYQANQQDRRGDFYQQGAQAFGTAVGGGIAKFGDRLKEIADNKETSAALDAGLETMRSTRPDLVPVIDEVQDKFYGSNVKGKQSIFSQLMAAGMRTDTMGQQATRDQMAQQELGLRRRGVEIQEGRMLHDTDPNRNMPMEYGLPEGTPGAGSNILLNPNTGNPIDIPLPPDTSGSVIQPLPGTNYGMALHNGKSMGVVPMMQGKQNDMGFRLAPIQGTGLALPIGPDGKQVEGMGPYQMKKATDFRGLLNNLIGKGEYEPVNAAGQKAPTVRDMIINPETGQKESMEWDSVNQKWIKPSQGLFPTDDPNEQPGKLNSSLDAALRASGY